MTGIFVEKEKAGRQVKAELVPDLSLGSLWSGGP